MRRLRSADLFCGAGGTSIGAQLTGYVDICYALNHWDLAIQTHSLNFPTTKHFQQYLKDVDPRWCDRIDLLFASPECTHFTVARGKRKMLKSSRWLANEILPWVKVHKPQWVVIENVVEFMKWGPLHDSGPLEGRPIKERAGEEFQAWLWSLRECGYQVEYRVLVAADYGAPTSRERLFVIARRGKKAPVWPKPTHTPAQHVPFASVLDRSLSLQQLGDRTKPLCATTLSALLAGHSELGDTEWLHGYYGNYTTTPLNKPLPTITTRDRFLLVDARSGTLATRMLSNAELAKAQGFPDWYQFCGNKKEVTVQIGNSVPPPFSEAIATAILSV